MKVAEICSSEVATARGFEELIVAAHRMRDRRVGFLVVIEPTVSAAGSAKTVIERPVGILTDRDLVMTVMAGGADAWLLRVQDVMTKEPVTASEHETVSDALARMRATGAQRLTVVSAQGSLVGVLSLDAVVDCLADELQNVVGAVRQEERNACAVLF